VDWKDELKVLLIAHWWQSKTQDDTERDIIILIEALLEQERKKVLEDCIETLLGCDENCAECEADNPHQDLWCPYKEKLQKLKEKWL
jgi:hypothetical protein